jgi:hypothetical protein
MKKVRVSGPFFVAHKNKSGRKNRSSYSRLFVINTNSDWLCGLSEKPRHIPVVVNVYFIRRRLLRESRHCHNIACINYCKTDRRTSRTVSVKPFGLPSFCGSSDREYCVFATQIGSLSLPSFSISEIAFSAFEVNTTSPAR